MSAEQTLAILRLLNMTILAAETMGVNVAELKQKIDAARAEGRDLTNDELREIADEAQAAIDRL